MFKRNEIKGPCICDLQVLRRNLSKWAVLHWIFGLIDEEREIQLEEMMGFFPTNTCRGCVVGLGGMDACVCVSVCVCVK